MITSIRDGRPAVCVKDKTLWARDERTRELISELGEGRVDAIYEGVREDFWRLDAPALARHHGYSGEVFSEGRSGGWLVLGDESLWLDYTIDAEWTIPQSDGDADEDTRAEYTNVIAERDKFLLFAEAITAAVVAAGETFVQRLTEACAELEAVRESCIVRSEN